MQRSIWMKLFHLQTKQKIRLGRQRLRTADEYTTISSEAPRFQLKLNFKACGMIFLIIFTSLRLFTKAEDDEKLFESRVHEIY